MAQNRDKILRGFGRHLAQLRHDAGLTQEEVAERSGLHANYIGDLERGERNPTLITLLAVAKAFGISVSELTEELE